MVRLFGTNGIREVVGERLTASFVTRVAEAIGRHAPVGPPIVVGWDGRTSSEAFAKIVSGTLALAGHRVITVGMLPTPAIQYNSVRLGGQLAVVVTASHNPPEFNGLKLIAADGLEVTRDVEEAVEHLVDSGAPTDRPFDRIGSIRADPFGADRYVDGVVAQVDREAIVRRKLTVVLDCGNGASTATSPTLLRRLGCRVVTLNGQLDGTFPGHLSEPTESNLADLVRTVPAVGADLGIAHDGDADRAVFVDATGRYVPGEKILALLGREFVRSSAGGSVVTPVSGSLSLEEAIRPLGGRVIYTRVGSPVVTREMLRSAAVFGGEENGGLIFPKFQLARDGAMTAAAVLELVSRSGSTLAQLIADLPQFTLVKQKVECPVELRVAVLARLEKEMAVPGVEVVTLDGLKVIRPEGWVLLRPSGTEPLVRIFAESKDPSMARRLAEDGVARVKAAIAETEHHPASPAVRASADPS